MMRRCDVQSCGAVRADEPMGMSGYTSFNIEGRSFDICPTCRKLFKDWMDGNAFMAVLPKPALPLPTT